MTALRDDVGPVLRRLRDGLLLLPWRQHRRPLPRAGCRPAGRRIDPLPAVAGGHRAFLSDRRRRLSPGRMPGHSLQGPGRRAPRWTQRARDGELGALREDGTVLRQWRQSYNLARVERSWQVLASTYHGDSHGHSPRHRQHLAGPAAQGRASRMRRRLREARVGEPDRQREGPDGARGDRARRGGRTTEARRHRRRIHRRQHRRLAGVGLRRPGLPHPHRVLRCLQPGEAGSDGGVRRGAHAGPERRRPHHQEADPRHDRGRPPAEPGAAHLLDRSAQQPRQHRGLLPAGRGDLAADQRRRSTPSCTASAPRPRRGVSPPC